jgi:tetratricopeptide (TPR) repeat protein
MKDYARAIKAYSKALKINSYNATAWFTMGCAQMRLNLTDAAITSFG